MNHAGLDELLAVLADVRLLLARPDNDHAWSGWADNADALGELDACIAYVRAYGSVPSTLRMFFLPTGPLQECSLSSGWGDEFCAVADRFDAAVARLST